MSYLITAHRADGTSRSWADVNDADALRLLTFWDRGLCLPAVRQHRGHDSWRWVIINANKFETIEAEAAAAITVSSTATLPYLQVDGSLGCGIVASTAGGLIDPQEG